MADSENGAALLSADIQEIKRMIPHRYPFLLVDRVVEIDGSKSAVGIKNVTFNEPHFQGHFPGAPIMPGVTIIEAMAQTAAVMVGVTMDMADKDLLVYFMAIYISKFKYFIDIKCLINLIHFRRYLISLSLV